jgi:hypothetical protein
VGSTNFGVEVELRKEGQRGEIVKIIKKCMERNETFWFWGAVAGKSKIGTTKKKREGKLCKNMKMMVEWDNEIFHVCFSQKTLVELRSTALILTQHASIPDSPCIYQWSISPAILNSNPSRSIKCPHSHTEASRYFGVWVGRRKTCMCGLDFSILTRGIDDWGFYCWTDGP